ncbi:uncharacterized protein [Aristolochia californica]|uniref:uncharacterized protein n=1 Tax=Aristolochia californica TaxID=171875 RepID=UPI0035D954B8
MEARPPVLAKRLWHIMRVVFFMLRKGISKRKLMMDLHLMMKRGKIAGKAIGNLMFHHHNSFSCRSQDPHPAFFAPREYEFSCSNSPAFPFHISKRSKNPHSYSYSHNHHHNYFSCMHPSSVEDEVAVSALQKTLEKLNSEKSAAASPMSVSWFGRSPAVRQLRITDSPFPIKNTDEDCHVDKEAEEFIEKFYEQLRLQKKMAALEARYFEDLCARSSG